MGTDYLLDTNTAIYFLDGLLPSKALDIIEARLDESGSYLSIISKIELLGWQAPTPNAMRVLESFVQESVVLTLSDEIAEKAIEIKRLRKIKLPDAVIAATAIVHNRTLISRNDEDFRSIPDLKYLNPFTDI